LRHRQGAGLERFSCYQGETGRIIHVREGIRAARRARDRQDFLPRPLRRPARSHSIELVIDGTSAWLWPQRGDGDGDRRPAEGLEMIGSTGAVCGDGGDEASRISRLIGNQGP
jgi:hypothetical protein